MAWITQLKSIELQLELFHTNAFNYHIYQETLNLPSFSDFTHFIYKTAPWMPHSIGLLHMNIPYGMPQSQHHSSGQQTLKLHVLSNAINQVYIAFFYSHYTQQI